MKFDVRTLPVERVAMTGLTPDYYPARLVLFDVDDPGEALWSVTLVGPCVLLIPVFAQVGITVRAAAIWADGSVMEEILPPE